MELNWDYKEFDISGLKLISPFYREDSRGYFLKSYESDIYNQWNIKNTLTEIFETWSEHSVIRGLHFQTKNPQAKIVRVLYGEVYDVAVDLRKGSKTFGQWKAVQLSEKNHGIFYIPEGFAHGFQVISDRALVSYQCIGKYFSEFDTGIYWKDSDLNIEWPIKKSIISEKDNKLMSFNQFIKNIGALERKANE